MVKTGVTPDCLPAGAHVGTQHTCPFPEPRPIFSRSQLPHLLCPETSSVPKQTCAFSLVVLCSHPGARIPHATSFPTQLLPPLAPKPFGDYSSLMAPSSVSGMTQGPKDFMFDEGIYEPGNPLGWWVLKDSFSCSLFLVSF